MEVISIFGTIALFATATVAVTEFANKLLKISNDNFKQYMSWIVATVMSIIGFVGQFGFFADYGNVSDWYGWVLTVLTGFGVGLASNGEYDIKQVREFLHFIESLLKPKNK